MKRPLAILIAVSLLPLVCFSAPKNQQQAKLYRWVDENGIVHYGDSIPAKYAEIERQVVNEHGITVDVLEAKKTDEQLAEEQRLEDLQRAREEQRRADQALLATYLTVAEIELHRDRRIELFQAQARVTELYLSNLKRRLEKLQKDASRYRPYSQNPDAEMIDPDLVADITTTKDTIERHEQNLKKFQEDEQNIVARFDGDIDRFKKLKGLN